MTFNEWLNKNHPGILLTPMQQQWIDAKERGIRNPPWGGGRQSGASFTKTLWREYLSSESRIT